MAAAVRDADDGLRADVDHARFARALTECMTVLPEEGRAAGAPGLCVVIGEGGASEYVVDTDGRSCTCPDARHRDRTCKHLVRALVATGEWPVPRWADRDALDDQLGLWCDGPRYAGGAD